MSLVWKLRVYSREGQKWGYFLLSKTYPVTGTVDTRQLLSNIHSVSSPFRMTWETLDGVYLNLGCTQHSGPETHRAHKCHEMTWRFVVWLVALFLFYLICPRENGLRSGISYLEHLESQHVESQGLERTQSRCHSEAQGSGQQAVCSLQ